MLFTSVGVWRREFNAEWKDFSHISKLQRKGFCRLWRLLSTMVIQITFLCKIIRKNRAFMRLHHSFGIEMVFLQCENPDVLQGDLFAGMRLDRYCTYTVCYHPCEYAYEMLCIRALLFHYLSHTIDRCYMCPHVII